MLACSAALPGVRSCLPGGVSQTHDGARTRTLLSWWWLQPLLPRRLDVVASSRARTYFTRPDPACPPRRPPLTLRVPVRSPAYPPPHTYTHHTHAHTHAHTHTRAHTSRPVLSLPLSPPPPTPPGHSRWPVAGVPHPPPDQLRHVSALSIQLPVCAARSCCTLGAVR